jgi:hypothetical protein
MTQTPYAGSGFDDAISEPPRTSVMAILSLVFSLIGCCLPIGLLGSLFGIFSLVGISGSQGRVTGKGLAIAGIIIGLITTGIWGGGIYASKVFYDKFYTGMTEPVLADIEAGDFVSARTALSPNVTITDEQFTQFREMYHDQMGAFNGVPDGWIAWFQAIKDPAIGPSMNAQSGGGNVIPMPGIFANGNALMVVHIDPNNPNASGMPAITDVLIVLPDGTEIRLSDPLPESEETPDDGG